MQNNTTLLNQLGYVNEKTVFARYYSKPGSLASKNILYEIDSTITLHNPSDKVVTIYSDETLDKVTNIFKTGRDAKVLESKAVADNSSAEYKIRALLEDGSEFTG